MFCFEVTQIGEKVARGYIGRTSIECSGFNALFSLLSMEELYSILYHIMPIPSS